MSCVGFYLCPWAEAQVNVQHAGPAATASRLKSRSGPPSGKVPSCHEAERRLTKARRPTSARKYRPRRSSPLHVCQDGLSLDPSSETTRRSTRVSNTNLLDADRHQASPFKGPIYFRGKRPPNERLVKGLRDGCGHGKRRRRCTRRSSMYCSAQRRKPVPILARRTQPVSSEALPRALAPTRLYRCPPEPKPTMALSVRRRLRLGRAQIASRALNRKTTTGFWRAFSRSMALPAPALMTKAL